MKLNKQPTSVSSEKNRQVRNEVSKLWRRLLHTHTIQEIPPDHNDPVSYKLNTKDEKIRAQANTISTAFKDFCIESLSTEFNKELKALLQKECDYDQKRKDNVNKKLINKYRFEDWLKLFGTHLKPNRNLKALIRSRTNEEGTKLFDTVWRVLGLNRGRLSEGELERKGGEDIEYMHLLAAAHTFIRLASN